MQNNGHVDSAAIESEAQAAPRVVQMFQAQIQVKSGRSFTLAAQVDCTDEDVLDLISEIALNLSSAARNRSATSRLIVPGNPVLKP